jgi:hypothetical protein
VATKLSAVELTQIATPFVVALINANQEKPHLIEQETVVNAALGLATKLYQGASDLAESSAGELSLDAMRSRVTKDTKRPADSRVALGDSAVAKEILDSGEL